MIPHFLIWSFGPKIGTVDRICHQTDSMNRFYLDFKTGPELRRLLKKEVCDDDFPPSSLFPASICRHAHSERSLGGRLFFPISKLFC